MKQTSQKKARTKAELLRMSKDPQEHRTRRTLAAFNRGYRLHFIARSVTPAGSSTPASWIELYAVEFDIDVGVKFTPLELPHKALERIRVDSYRDGAVLVRVDDGHGRIEKICRALSTWVANDPTWFTYAVI